MIPIGKVLFIGIVLKIWCNRLCQRILWYIPYKLYNSIY